MPIQPAIPSSIKITECPRDAMQGLARQIPTADKIEYLNALLRVGFNVLDFGSFVSPKAIPQLADTAQVLASLHRSHDAGDPNQGTELLAIVANTRGAVDALTHPGIDRIGFPFSLSETFQKRNTGAGIEQGLLRIEEILELTHKADRQLTVYLSMGFGNPYGDPWHEDELCISVERLSRQLGVSRIALSDTLGLGNPQLIERVFSLLVPTFQAVELGGHMHVEKGKERSILEALWRGGCRHIDGALGGFGGCPMAQNDLVGNLSTEALLDFSSEVQPERAFNTEAWNEAQQLAGAIFN
jgi:hydroxymethylglutaryl-CoA lyase